MISASDLTTLAMNAGFSPDDAVIAAAVAMAESSGNPSAVGDQGNSIGLWQINLPAHPEFRNANLRDPQTNANAAFSVWQQAGGSFHPWTTYNTGAYQQYLAPLPGAPVSSVSPALVDVPASDATSLAPAPASSISAGGILLAAAAGLGLYWLADALAD